MKKKPTTKAPTKKKPTKKPVNPPLEAVLNLLAAANGAKPSKSTGACIYLPPGSVQPKCFMLTSEQCAAIQGTFVGGQCPTAGAEVMGLEAAAAEGGMGGGAGLPNLQCPSKGRACIKARLFALINAQGPTSPPTESRTYPQIGLNAEHMRRVANFDFFGFAVGPVTSGECGSSTSIGQHITGIQSK